MTRLHRAGVVVVVVPWLVVSAAACGGATRDYRCGPTATSGDGPDPAAIWACNREIAARAARGDRFSLDELRGAVEFFEALTGIDAVVGETRFGPVPGEAFRRSLARWDAWHEANRDRLRWDRRRSAVVVAPG